MKSYNLRLKQKIESDFAFLEALITEINELISTAKNLYYKSLAKKLKNPLL